MRAHLVSVAALLAVGAPTLARAQGVTTSATSMNAERGYFQHRVPAPAEALELTVGTGYTQPFGMLQSGVGFPSVAKAGIGVELGAGYRITPHWGLLLGGQYQELTPEQLDAVRGLTFTAAVQYHIAPLTRIDPWVELGSGYRMLWAVPFENAPTALDHGLQLARARVGFDVRVSPDFAFAPVVGADLTTFLWEDAGSNRALPSPTVSTFVFAGVQARIDVGGTNVGETITTSAPMAAE
jgi:hypothetical protein